MGRPIIFARESRALPRSVRMDQLDSLLRQVDLAPLNL